MRSPDQIGPVLALLGAVVFVGVLVRAARNRIRAGAAPDRVHCPKCGVVVPLVPAPPSFRQAASGGYTCKACGQSMDRWGRAKA